MKIKTSTIRIKLIMSLFASVGLAGCCMLILCVFMILASSIKPFAIFFNRHLLVFVILFAAIFSGLTIIFFLIFVKSRIRYLEEITTTLDTIAEGNLEINIPVKTTDELGKMAQTVNTMAYKLKTSIEEERRLEQSKNDLITNISHDLRTPLTSILGYLELIIGMDYTKEESLRHYSNIAYNQCKELKILIEELFELTKLNTSGLVLNKIHFCIREFLEQVILGFIPVFKSSGMDYRLNFTTEKLHIDADPLLLKRVFDNLINNAIVHGIEGKYVDMELLSEKKQVVIRIINYGKVISDSDLPHIFEKFYQADKSRSKQIGGAGLGLAIVRSIVQLHNGSINVSNADNKTTFEVRLEIS